MTMMAASHARLLLDGCSEMATRYCESWEALQIFDAVAFFGAVRSFKALPSVKSLLGSSAALGRGPHAMSTASLRGYYRLRCSKPVIVRGSVCQKFPSPCLVVSRIKGHSAAFPRFYVR